MKLKFTVRAECCMFSNKPDHLVVYMKSNGYHVVLHVEDKKDHPEIFTKKQVGGQVCDYIMLNKMLHGHPSIAVLTTYNKTKVCWDPDCSDEMIEDAQRFSKESLNSTVKTLSSLSESQQDQTSVGQGAPPAGDEGLTTPPVSQPKQPLKSSPPEMLRETATSVTNEPGSSNGTIRSIEYDEATYPPEKILSVLCNAIILSLKIGLSTIKIDASGLRQGQTVLVLRSKGAQGESNGKPYEWRVENRNAVLSGPWTSVNRDEPKEFIVTSIVGVGSTSRCWGAVVESDDAGSCFHSCVVKYWIKIWDEDTNEYIDEEEMVSQSDKSSQQEVENYKKIYNNLLFSDSHTSVGRFIINGVWCVSHCLRL